MDTLHNPRRGSHGRPSRPPGLPVLATLFSLPGAEPPAPGPLSRPRPPPPHRRASRAPYSPPAGTSPRLDRPLDVHPTGGLRYESCQHGTKHATALYPAPPSLEPHGGCGPRMTSRHQPPCPGGQLMLKPGACITAQRGESPLVSLLLVCCSPRTCCFAIFCAVTLKFRFS